MNVPIGIVAALIIATAMRDLLRSAGRASIDYAGALLMMGSITLLLWVLAEGGRVYAWDSWPILVATGAWVSGAWLFFRVEGRVADPILPLTLFKNRMFRTACLTGFLLGVPMFCALSFIPLFVQGVIGTTATEAGSALTPLMLGWVISSMIGSRLLLHIGIRPTVIAGLLMLLTGFGLMAFMNAHTSRASVAWTMAVVGGGLGLAMTPLLIAMQNAVPRSQLGVATSASHFFRSIGGALGAALLGTIMTTSMKTQLDYLGQSSLAGVPVERLRALVQQPEAMVNPVMRQLLPSGVLNAMQDILAVALNYTFLVGLLITAMGLFAACAIPRHSVQELETMKER